MPLNLLKLRDKLDQEQGGAARGAAITAPPVAPDAMARALKYSDATGVPPLVVADNLPEYDERADLDAVEAAARANPALAHLFRQPENVALARNDVAALSAYGNLGRVDKVSPMQPGTRITDLLAGRSIQQFAGDFGIRARMASRSMQSGLVQFPVDVVNYANSRLNDAATGLASIFGQTPDSQVPMLDPWADLRRNNAALDAEDMARLSLQSRLQGEYADEAGREAGRTGGVLGEAAQAVKERIRNPGQLVDDAGMVVGSMAGPAGPLSRASAGTQITLGAAGQAGSVSADVQNNLEADGVAPDARRRAAAEAAAAAMGIGLVLPRAVPGGDSFERWAAGEMGRKIGGRAAGDVARSTAIRVGTPLLGETFSEGGEEALIQATTNVYSGDPVGHGVGTAGVIGAMGGLGMGTAPAVAEAARRSYQAAAERDYVDSAVERATQSKLREIAPERFEAYAERTHPGAMVYLPTEAVVALYQDPRTAEAAVFDLTGDRTAWEEAVASGELGIPLSKYVTNLADQHATLGSKLRMEAGESLAEPVLPDRETVLADFEAAMAEAEKSSDRDTGPAGEVYDAVYGQLLGTYDDAAAAQQAAVAQAFYRTMAERTGKSAMDLWERFPLDITTPKGKVGPRRRGVDVGIDPLIDAALSGKSFTDSEIFGGTLASHVIALGGINPESVGGGDLRAIDAGKRPGLLNLAGMTVERMAETLADNGWANTFTTKDEAGRPDYRELLSLLADDLGGDGVRERTGGLVDPVRMDKRQVFRQQAEEVGAALREYSKRTGEDLATLPRERLREIAEGAFADGGLEQATPAGQTEVEFAREEESITSRLATWASGLQFGGGSPRPVAANAESLGPVARNQAGAAQQGDEPRAVLREQSQRLIERAKADGFFWPDDSPILAALDALPADVKGGGAEHNVYIVGEGAERFVIRGTDNGYFGHRADISPAQYLARLDDYSATFPSMQQRLIGVSESPDVEGHAVIWTVQPFVYGTNFDTQEQLAAAMAEQGWDEDGYAGVPRFKHRETGTVIEDAHTDNVLRGEDGTLYPFDVVVEALPAQSTALYQSERPFYSQLITAIEGAKQEKAPGAQWLGWLMNLPKLTKEEVEFYDLPAWLSGQKSVTRQALLDYLRANELTIEEDVKGAGFKSLDLRDLPFKVRVEPMPRAAGLPGERLYFVDGPNGSMGFYQDADEAERAAYDFTVGYARAQGGQMPELPRGYTIARTTAEDLEAIGLDASDGGIGEWALFEDGGVDQNPRDRGEMITGLQPGLTYAEAVQAAGDEAGLLLGAGDAEQLGFNSQSAPYANMTLPGGTGYKVMLLRLPLQDPQTLAGQEVARQYGMTIVPQGEIRRIRAADGMFIVRPNEFGTRPPADARFATEEEQAALTAIFDAATSVPRRHEFTAGHWSEPNVVAHVRFDERTDADGKRVLFVQELQSDWHQKGRKQGYQGVLNAQYPARDAMAADVGWQVRPATDAERRSFGLDDAAPAAVHVTYGDGSTSLYSADDIDSALRKEWGIKQTMRFYNGQGSMPQAEWDALAANVAALEKDDSNGSAVPDAPFKTTWPELVMKRMLRYAAENGFDRVAWPTPEQVPQIEQWGVTLSDIKSNPGDAKRFGAILDRYATEVPRIAKRLTKQLGGRLVESDLRMAKPTGAYQSFRDAVEGRMEEEVGSAYTRDLLARVTDQLAPDIEAAPVEAVQSAVDEVLYGIANEDGFPEIAEMMRAAAAGLTSKESAGLNPAIEITPTMRDAVLGGLPLFQKGAKPKAPRADVLIPEPDAQGRRSIRVNLFAGADRSSFMHEAGHAFMEILGDLAADPGADPAVVRDFHAALRFMKAPGDTDAARAAWWRGQPIAARREQHETWARGFEAYLREGKAPSPALRSAFARFKVWLTNLYRSLVALDVELTDDVRGVFDRMLATDAEIAQARTRQYQDGLIAESMAAEVMSPEDFEVYHAAVEAARADAEAALAAEVLREEERATRAFLGEERRRIRAEVEATTRALPVYRALRILRNAKLPDGTPTEPMKLDKEVLLDDYGPSFLKHLRGTYAVSGGVHPDSAAGALGYASGRELVEALVNAPKLQEVIEADTDRILRERYPDPMRDGSLAERAMVAVHREKQAEAMLLEVQALERHTTGRVQTQAAALKEVARRMLAGKPLRRLQPSTYRAAEAKWGKAAFDAAARQDWEEAASARRMQLLNHLLFAEATRARKEGEAAVKYLKGFTKTKRRAAIGKAGHDYLEQIDGLLERFDFRVMSGKAMDRRAGLADWIRAKAAQDVHVDLPPMVLDEAFRVPFAELTVGQMRQLRDSVKHLAHLADVKNTLLLKGQRRDREDVDNEVAESVLDNSPSLADVPGEPLRGLAWSRYMGWARATLGAATDMARRLDGYKDLGPVWRHTVGVIRDAINNAVNPELQKAAETVSGLYRGTYSKDELRRFGEARAIPGVRGLWSKDRILSLALNWGNEGNRKAILTQAKQRLSPEEVGLLLGTLSGRDWTFVQGVWRAVDAYWPEIAESQRRRKGLVPEKVAASPFTVTTADGQQVMIPGGYYPLKYEADGTARGMREEADEFYESIRTGRFAKASTKDGHTIERIGSGGRSVNLSLAVLDTHLRDVIRDLHLGDAVNYVHQVLKGPAFSAALSDTTNVELARGLDLWLRDVATGEVGLRDIASKSARFLRQNFTAAALTYKFVSAALQLTGIVQTSVVLGKAATIRGVQRYARRPVAMTRYVTSASPFMRMRVNSHIESVQEVLDARSGRIKSAHGKMIRGGYWMIGRVQQIVDVSTWLGAEAKGMEMFAGDVDKARAYADDIVSRAQGSGEFMDKTSLQRGTFGDSVRQSEFIRAATALQGYMITKHNAIVERTLKAKAGIDGINAKSVAEGMKWAGDMSLLLVLESIIVAAIRGSLPGDDDDDGAEEEVASFLATETASGLFGGIPGLGAMVTSLRGYDSMGVVSQMWSDVAKAIEQSKQGEVDKALVKASIKAAGYGTGIPSGQINKTIDAIAAKRGGQDVSAYDYLTGPDKK